MNDEDIKILAINSVRNMLLSENSNILMSIIVSESHRGSPIHQKLYETVRAVDEQRYEDIELQWVVALQIHLEARMRI